jgi:hypothetical protein
MFVVKSQNMTTRSPRTSRQIKERQLSLVVGKYVFKNGYNTIIYKLLRRWQKIEQHDPRNKLEANSGSPEGSSSQVLQEKWCKVEQDFFGVPWTGWDFYQNEGFEVRPSPLGEWYSNWRWNELSLGLRRCLKTLTLDTGKWYWTHVSGDIIMFVERVEYKTTNLLGVIVILSHYSLRVFTCIIIDFSSLIII